MKVAILVDVLGNKGGIERIVLLQAKLFNADIYAGRYIPKTTFKEFNNFKITEINKTKFPQRIWSFYNRIKFCKLNLTKYDLVIMHGGGSLSAAKNNKNNIWYCHAPTIWLYSTTNEDLGRIGFFKRNIIKLIIPFLKKIDKKNVSFVKKIITNSKNVKERVLKIYNRTSEVIYPPVDLEKFKYESTNNFYLSSARLTPDKRVDVIVKAFQQMPDKKLVVASGGSDLEKIKKLAENYKNIEVLGWVSDEKLKELYGGCIATLAASYYEDFGMIAIESMAAGKPMIASLDKGFAESIINNKTGFLINPTMEEIIKYVKILDKKKAIFMKDACENRAKLFSEEIFMGKFKKSVKEIFNEND